MRAVPVALEPPRPSQIARLSASVAEIAACAATGGSIMPARRSARTRSVRHPRSACRSARRFARTRAHIGAGAGAHLDQSDDLQRDQRFAHGRAADVELRPQDRARPAAACRSRIFLLDQIRRSGRRSAGRAVARFRSDRHALLRADRFRHRDTELPRPFRQRRQISGCSATPSRSCCARRCNARVRPASAPARARRNLAARQDCER